MLVPLAVGVLGAFALSGPEQQLRNVMIALGAVAIFLLFVYQLLQSQAGRRRAARDWFKAAVQGLSVLGALVAIDAMVGLLVHPHLPVSVSIRHGGLAFTGIVAIGLLPWSVANALCGLRALILLSMSRNNADVK